MFTRGGTWLALAMSAALLAVLPMQSAGADDPATCPSTFPVAYTYIWDSNVADGLWQKTTGTNWLVPSGHPPGSAPNDRSDGPADPAPSYACIGPGVTVHVDANHDRVYDIQALWLAPGSTLIIEEGAGLFVHSLSIESYAASGSQILVDQGSFGGQGTLRSRGLVQVEGTNQFASSLGSNWNLDPEPANAGTLHIDTGGVLSLPAFGMNLWRRYKIVVDGSAELTNNGFLAVAYDSSVALNPGGTLEFGGTGGYYEGPPNPNAVISLVNDGTILKSGVGTTSLIGSDYSQTGEVLVTGGVLAFAGGTTYGANVDAGQSLSTEKCAPRAPNENSPCVTQLNPAGENGDPESVKFTVPAADASGAVVRVHEDSPLVFTAHADNLDATQADPAILTFRLGTTYVGTRHPADVQIDRLDDLGHTKTLLTCPASGLPPGETNCVDRQASHRDGLNVFMVVRTTETSRYISRKDDVTPPQVLKAASALSVRLKKAITLTTTFDEAATVTVFGRIKTKKVKVRHLDLSATVNATADTPATVVLNLTKKQKKKLKKAGARKGSVTLTVVAQDSRGNNTTQTVTVKLT